MPRVLGVPALLAALRRIGTAVGLETEVVLDNAARELLGRSVALAPELTRRLILSAKITKVTTPSGSARVVSFDTPYAVIRHEDFYELGPISTRKAPTEDGTPGRKYLERPFNTMNPDIQRKLAEAVTRAAKK